ncbi:hypothetical protein O9H85_35055 [Paenibacillus filicis]|uniref:Uncharacterized protein n=1 Tax=Paenibacillus gyeongsangnamensis TaxID=3388067 RepID=A0ABT4QKS9_9BACL|nr:hypothetical protein [Paenibacillus filicis]MCZ8517470.1 hypothetical protein [Paenibacillus filicis]
MRSYSGTVWQQAQHKAFRAGLIVKGHGDRVQITFKAEVKTLLITACLEKGAA